MFLRTKMPHSKLIFSVVAAVGAIISVGAASAADLAARPYTKAPAMVAAVYDWSGFYIGGQIGGATSRGAYTTVETIGSEAFSYDPSSFIGGGHLGVQGQWGSWVLGAEGTYNFTSLKQTDPSILFAPRTRSLSAQDIATVVGKLGYAAGPWMFYAKGGFADSKIDTHGFNPLSGVFADVNDWRAGYTVGGGIDYMFAKNWIAGVDFNYYDFRFNRPTLATSGTAFTFANGKDQVYAGMFRLSYLFNWASPVVARY
jgi:outer membrane immunogenic protein